MSRSNDSPQKFMCAVDGEWLVADKFSRTQMAKWERIKGEDGVTAGNAGLICKEHTKQTTAPYEIQCSGPCGLWKHRDHFSKNQRNNPDAQCIDCTLWACNFTGDEALDEAPSFYMQQYDILSQAMEVQEEAPAFAAPGAALGDRPNQLLPADHDAHDNGVEVGEVDESVLRSITSMLLVDSDGQPADLPPSHPDHRGPARATTTPAVENTTDGGYLPSIDTSTVTATATSTATATANASDGKDARMDRLYGYNPFDPSGKSAKTASNDGSGEPSGEPSSKAESKVSEDQSGKWFRGDSRRVFYAAPAYANRMTDLANSHIADSDSEDN
ncbi:uncharacterized protein F4812DRAFT_455299 [Daldinia caldariorum]|uniref:uncharacterized protein n=1 Tax=Daldinia caldariorum TaxID=326644 RepID=UPI0020079A68|nr:uncharacterized protein F4812DRAFT_455299 [Daldinia caldariorum]KAI1471188.1 hypothetical protein F4812DRAFT_455299 [Daldinia caldariorum]